MHRSPGLEIQEDASTEVVISCNLYKTMMFTSMSISRFSGEREKRFKGSGSLPFLKLFI